MFWPLLLLLSIFALANGSHSKENDFLGSSVSDTLRRGAAIASTFLNPKPFGFLSSGFRKLAEANGNGKNEFIFVMLRLLGVDNRKVTDLALNGIISAVRLMSQVLLKDGEKSNRKGRNTSRKFSLFRFIMTQPQVVDLLNQMENPNLVDLILEEAKEKLKDYPEENVQCILLLICKTKPFVRGMQRSLRFFTKRENVPIPGTVRYGPGASDETCGDSQGEETCHREVEVWERANLEDRMYFFVPDLSDVIEEGDKCDLLFPNCVY